MDEPHEGVFMKLNRKVCQKWSTEIPSLAMVSYMLVEYYLKKFLLHPLKSLLEVGHL